MKILVIGGKSYYTHSLIYALKKLQHDVSFYLINNFTDKVSWIQRKKYFWGWDNEIFNHFIKKESINIKSHYDQYNPDIVIVFDTYSISDTIIKHMGITSKVVMWLICTLKEEAFYNKIHGKLNSFDVICTYEEDDTVFLKNNLTTKILFCPVGFDDRFYKKDAAQQRDIDIVFVGVRSNHRLNILEKIATYVYKNNLTMIIYGISFEDNARHFWKRTHEKHKFLVKYPYLSKYIANITNITPDKVAEVYQKSKIVLNINRTDSLALNPRTFEILATNSFEIMDNRDSYCGLVTPGKDLAVYYDENDIIDKISYYLEHETERNAIASNGYNQVHDNFTMVNIVKKMLDKI
ncbi:CgeB family protein [Pectinatus sottacetonis]|uniref:CgeB family protein n=1 Tax=Pectinatus sottacetonis TaxID=1002795 RepID=UPI0018C61D0E|nr:glycosyltransferase [Pectinatus sottacetonis]